MTLAGPADADAVAGRLVAQGETVGTWYNSSGGFYCVQPTASAPYEAEADAPTSCRPLYVPINARTQQLTPALLLQVLDSTHAATSVPAAAAAGVGAGCGGGSPVAGRQAEEAGQQHQQRQQQQQQGAPGLAAAVFPAPAKMVNFALVDGRDVVMMPVFDGLQPPAEGQQRH